MDKDKLIGAGFAVFNATKVHRLAEPWTRGQGAILMFHRVLPPSEAGFAPNRLLEITPEFLEAVIGHVRARGFEIVSLDEAVASIGVARRRPFAVLSFDDGYIDNERFALPVLRKHAAPFTMFVTTGFADGTARLWWVELERAIQRLDRLDAPVTGLPADLPASTDDEKNRAFKRVYRHLRAMPEPEMLAVIGALLQRAGVDGASIAAELCLAWAGIERLAGEPLCTIGAHTLTHPMLAKHPEAFARREIVDGKAILEARLGRAVRHLAYPVGDAGVAGRREFEMAAAAGYASAVTTRPGMIFPAHARAPTALPRLSVNGCWQRLDVLDVLLSGAAFAVWNRGRRYGAAA